MKISSKKSKSGWTVKVEGDLTIYTAAEFKSHLEELVTKNIDFEIDLSAVQDFDSAGLQVLMQAKRELKVREHNLRLSAHSRSVIEVFELCNVTNYFGDPVVISTC